MLRSSAAGFGSLALSGIIASQQSASALANPAGTGHLQQLHFPQRARRIIFLFMWGGPSHVDLFDPKPRLLKDQGQPISAEAVGNKKQTGISALPLDRPSSSIVTARAEFGSASCFRN